MHPLQRTHYGSFLISDTQEPKYSTNVSQDELQLFMYTHNKINSTPKNELNETTTGFTMEIFRGFKEPPKEKQPGGKENKRPLPTQSILVRPHHPTNIIPMLRVRVVLMGYDRSLERQRLKTYGESALFPLHDGNYIANFDHLVLTHSSHNCGKRLFLLFELYNLLQKGVVLAHVESAEFQTISRRGELKNKVRRKVKEEKKRLTTAKIYSLDPNMGPVVGGDLVRIHGENLPQGQNIIVKFGKWECRQVYQAGDTLICEVPESPHPGCVEIKISFDEGKTFFNTDLTYTYIGFSQEKIKEYIQYLFKQKYN